MFSKPETSSGIPVYLQLVEQVKHAIATGTIRAGDQLPGVRRAAEELLINPNTVVKAYKELEHESFIEVRHGAGAFVSHSAPSLRRTELIRDAIAIVRTTVEELRDRGVTDAEMRRLLESELIRARTTDVDRVNAHSTTNSVADIDAPDDAELRDLVEPDATGIS